jgi:hypothetical protein
VSQNSTPWPDPDPEPTLGGGLGAFGRRMVVEDLGKLVVERLAEVQPDLLVLDLIDERLPLRRVGTTWLTCSDYLEATTVGASTRERADETSLATDAARAHMFAVAALAVGQQLLTALPRTTVVLNQAPYTTQLAGGGDLPEPAAGWARELDHVQQPMVEALVAALGPRLLVLRPPQDVALADPDHRWGVASYHYVDDYYHWLIDALTAVEPVATSAPWYPSLSQVARSAQARPLPTAAASPIPAAPPAALGTAARAAAARARLRRRLAIRQRLRRLRREGHRLMSRTRRGSGPPPQ